MRIWENSCLQTRKQFLTSRCHAGILILDIPSVRAKCLLPRPVCLYQCILLEQPELTKTTSRRPLAVLWPSRCLFSSPQTESKLHIFGGSLGDIQHVYFIYTYMLVLAHQSPSQWRAVYWLCLPPTGESTHHQQHSGEALLSPLWVVGWHPGMEGRAPGPAQWDL